MAQLASTQIVYRGQKLQSNGGTPRPVEAPSIRIHVPVGEEQRKKWRYRALTIQDTQPIPRPVIKLQPIVSKPLRPYVLRESACGFLECRTSSRRCIASKSQRVTLEYQVAYCLGFRHQSCPLYSEATDGRKASKARMVMYAAAILLIACLAAAVAVQAFGASAPVEVGRAVGLV